ncbi:hypothetical protein Tco_1418402 [Tanacetum coccineum]
MEIGLRQHSKQLLVDEELEEEEFEEEEEPQEEEDDMEPIDVIEVEDTVESKDETVLASVHKVGESSTVPFLREDSDGLLPGLIRRDINSLFGRIASFSRQLYGRETRHALVKKKGKAKYEYYGKLILDLGNEVQYSVEERTAPMENLVRKLGNAKERAEGKKVKFAAATLQGPTMTWWNSKRFNELALMCPRMVEPESVKVDAYIKGKVTSSRPAKLNEAVRMAHELMEQKSQARNERILEGNKQKCLLDHFLCVNIALLAMLVNVRSSAISVERLGAKRAQAYFGLAMIKQKEVREVRGRAYMIKHAEPHGPNVVMEPKEKRLEDVPVIRDFPEGFVSCHHIVWPPSEMRRLSVQCKSYWVEGFIRSSSSP